MPEACPGLLAGPAAGAARTTAVAVSQANQADVDTTFLRPRAGSAGPPFSRPGASPSPACAVLGEPLMSSGAGFSTRVHFDLAAGRARSPDGARSPQRDWANGGDRGVDGGERSRRGAGGSPHAANRACSLGGGANTSGLNDCGPQGQRGTGRRDLHRGQADAPGDQVRADQPAPHDGNSGHGGVDYPELHAAKAVSARSGMAQTAMTPAPRGKRSSGRGRLRRGWRRRAGRATCSRPPPFPGMRGTGLGVRDPRKGPVCVVVG